MNDSFLNLIFDSDLDLFHDSSLTYMNLESLTALLEIKHRLRLPELCSYYHSSTQRAKSNQKQQDCAP